MEIFNMIRGHFALLVDRPLYTPEQHKEFHIESVGTKEGDWQIILRISTGKKAKVYISDILRVYTYIVSMNRPLTESVVNKYVKANCVTKGCGSYVIPLIGTFSDIIITTEPSFTIRFKQLYA